MAVLVTAASFPYSVDPLWCVVNLMILVQALLLLFEKGAKPVWLSNFMLSCVFMVA
jgi:hypothetical protein